MAKKAVLVGCNYPKSKAELHGCINDVRRIQKSLVDRFGFDESDMRVLIDTDRRYTQPTGANIKRAPTNWLQNDECIVPCDMNLITDDDFREIVDKVPQGVTFTMVSDSCHSGGLINNAKEQIGESTQRGGRETMREGGGFREQFRGFLSGKIHKALDERGIDIHNLHHPHNQHHRIRVEDEYFQQVPYEGESCVKSRALPISTLIDILKQESGKEDIDVGMIRPTLFDMFGQDSSSKVKKFMKVLFQSVRHNGDADSATGHHHHGIVSALAQQFMKHKLDEVDDTDAYLKPALEMHVSGVEQAYAGVGVTSRLFRDMGVLVSGCQSSETSADENPSGNSSESYGAMSNAVQMVLSEHDGPVTNHELVMKVRKAIKNQGFSQRPGLYCADQNVNAVFIC